MHDCLNYSLRAFILCEITLQFLARKRSDAYPTRHPSGSKIPLMRVKSFNLYLEVHQGVGDFSSISASFGEILDLLFKHRVAGQIGLKSATSALNRRPSLL